MKTLNEQPPTQTPNDPEWLKGIKEVKERFLAITGKERETAIELGFATQIINDSEKLRACDKVSIMNAIINVARTGITLNPVLGLAHLVNRGGKCCLHFDYKGLVKILKDNNCIKDIQAVIVYEDETYEEGISQITPPKHIKKYAKTEEEQKARNYFGVYCQVVLLDNTVIFTQLMPYWEVLKAEKSSPAASSEYSPWQRNKWRESMIKKTKIRHDFKLLIAGNPNDKLQAAVEVEDAQYTEVKNELPEHKTKAADLFATVHDATVIEPEKQKAEKAKAKKQAAHAKQQEPVKMEMEVKPENEYGIDPPVEPHVEAFFTAEELEAQKIAKDKIEQGKILRKKANM